MTKNNTEETLDGMAQVFEQLTQEIQEKPFSVVYRLFENIIAKDLKQNEGTLSSGIDIIILMIKGSLENTNSPALGMFYEKYNLLMAKKPIFEPNGFLMIPYETEQLVPYRATI